MSNIKIGISGCLGRMGQDLVSQVKKDKRVRYIGGFDLVGGFDINDRNCQKDEIFDSADVIIDFSSPRALKNNIDLSILKKTGLVIGTTGMSEKNIYLLKNASKKIPILTSSNMCLSVNLLFNLVEKTASILRDIDYDIEIGETHHKHKKDAPSGTALSLGKCAAKGRKANFKKISILNRTSKNNLRKKGDIGFAVTRGGEVTGEHTVSFIGPHDRLELIHKAGDRSIFVKGAIDAAVFINKKKRGLYNMSDLLDN